MQKLIDVVSPMSPHVVKHLRSSLHISAQTTRRRESKPLPLTLFTALCMILVGCEGERPQSSSSNRNVVPIKGSEDTRHYEDQDLAAEALDQMPYENLDLARPDQLPLDMELDISPDMSPDMDLDMEVIPCEDGARRQGAICGVEECVANTWVGRASDFEICNNHDDDCDGTTDEPAIADATLSSCCTDQQCIVRAYCDRGMCINLADGACRLPDDCEPYESCEDEACVVSHTVYPPAFPRGCADPVEIAPMDFSTSPSIEPLVISGDLSDALLFTPSDDVCGNSIHRREETQLGHELVFRFAPRIVTEQRYTLRAQVSVNDIAIPITLRVLRRCTLNTLADVCLDSHDAQNDGHQITTQFVASANSIYFIVLDTFGSELQRELIVQQAQHSDVSYELSVYAR